MHKQLNHILSNFSRKRILLFVLFLSLALLGTAIYRFAQQNNWLEKEFAQQANQIELNKHLTQLNLYIKDVESASRGYSVTGNKDFIKGFAPLLDSIHLLYQKLPKLQSKNENAADSILFLKLGNLLERKITFTKRIKQSGDENNLKTAQKLIATTEGLVLTDSITNIIEQIRPVHSDELRDSQDNFLRINNRNNNLAYWCVSVAILLIILSFYLLQIQVKQTKKINECLSLEREYFNITLNSLNEGLISTDNEGLVLFMNPSAERLTGWNIFDAKAEPLQHVFDVENEETGLPFENIVSRIINTGQVIELENKTILKAKTGNRYVINNNGAPLLDKNGNISGTVVVFSDITEKKKAETALMESEKQYKALIENLPEAVYTCDVSGYIQLYNKAAVKLWGREPIPGKDLWCGSWKIFNVDGTDLPLDSCPMAITLQEGRPVYGKEIMVMRQDGTLRHVLPNPYPLFNSEGALTGAVNMLIDVTDKKEREILIKKTEEKYHNLIEQASDAILIYSFDGTIYEFNKSCYTQLGYSLEEYSKLKLTDILLEEIVTNQENYKAVLSGETRTVYRHLKRKDGTLIESEVTVKLLSDGKAIAFARDITERRKAEAAIKKEKDLSDFIINSLPGVFYLTDKNLNFIRWNKNFETVTGYNAAEIAKLHPLELFDEADKSFIEDNIARLMTNGGVSIETEVLTKNKNKITYFLTGFKIEIEGDTQLIGIGIDITQRKKAEKELADYKYALDQSSIVAITDQKGIIRHANENFCKISKFTAAELIGQDHRIVNSGYHSKAFIKNLWHTVANGKIWRNEICNKAKDGTNYWVDTTIVPFLNDRGKPYQYVVIRSDITQKKEDKKKLESAVNRYDILSQATSDTIWDWDIASNKMIYNDGITKMFGYELSEVGNVVDWWNDKLHSEDFQMVTDSLEDIFEKGMQKFQLTYRFRCADGSYKNILDRAFVVFDEQGKPCRIIGAMQDITYQTEEEMRVAKAIIDAHEAERNFLGAELHDNINQILVGTLLTLGMAKSKDMNAFQRVEFVETSMNYIKEAIEETRKLSHNLAPVSFEDKSLKNLFENLLVNINLEGRFDIRLRFDEIKATGIPENIQVNLYRILQEQAKNILKYANASSIEIDLIFNLNSVSMRIYDNGKGFNTKDLKKGIGLRNIQKRAELLSGKFIMNSSPGKGCEIIVELPLYT